jgi:hypothetical protein
VLPDLFLISKSTILEGRTEVQSRLVDILASAARQILSVAMILFGSVLAVNVSAGPCGGTALAVEPFPSIFVAVVGLELIVGSYFLVKKLQVESDYRVIIYLFLAMWSMSLLAVAVNIARSGVPRRSEDLNDFYFSLLRGIAAIANLMVFYRWAGTKNMITRLW